MPTPLEIIAANEQAAAAVAARNDALAAELLNAPTETVVKPYMMTKRQLHVDFGFLRGTAIITGLKMAAASQSEYAPAFAELVSLLESDAGLDVGRPDEELAALTSLIVGAGIATEQEMAILTAHGREQTSLWRLHFGRDATVDEISKLYIADRVAADNAATLELRRQAYVDAVQSQDAVAIARYGRELTQTLGGEAAKEIIDNGS